VELRCGGSLLIFDGGTGLRPLGQTLIADMPVTAHLFFSHVHWDHIQGFPFFRPAFVQGNTIHMYGPSTVTGTVENAMAGQMASPNFPVKLDQLPSELVFHDIAPGSGLDVGDDIHVKTAAGNHPGGVLAYRIEHAGRVFVYMTDTERGTDADAALVELARGANVLVHDCQYTPEEYEGTSGGPRKVGWGHSTLEGAVRTAREARVERLVLFHHDPDQDDAAVRAKEARARELFPNALAAYEGLEVDV
jgi:phosphoribosyl 1,2-cyclic phosphodiesterase